MINLLIIEDEIKAARELKSMVEQLHKDVKVCGIVHSVEEALEWFGKNKMPNLILSDIQLADGLSFDIFRSIGIHSPVIFCTAYDHYALQAFETNGIDYMLKPIDKEKLKNSFEKLFKFKDFLNLAAPEYHTRFDNILFQLNGKAYKNSVLVYAGNKIISIDTVDIQFIHSANNIVYLHTASQKFEIKETLESILKELSPVDFYRANRQTIISRKAISNIRQSDARKLESTQIVTNFQPVRVSKEKASAFLRWLKGK